VNADEMDPKLVVVGNAIESLCCVEMRTPTFDAGIVRPLAQMAHDKQGGPPVLLGAQRLAERVGRGDAVVILTGYYFPKIFPKGETDGPVGAAALAHAISKGLGAATLVLCEKQCLEPVRASFEAIGLTERPIEEAVCNPLSFAIDTFPTDNDPQAMIEDRTEEIFSVVKPKAIAAIEKTGVNAKGVPHRIVGERITDGRLCAEPLIRRANRSGVLTIGVGDRGNELGLGLVADGTRQYAKYGAVCTCPCQGGVAAADVVDVTVVASVSNWGAYGIAAMLATILGNENVLHDPETEVRVIEACYRAGSHDGAFYDNRPWVDGLPARINSEIIDIMGTIVRMAIGHEWH